MSRIKAVFETLAESQRKALIPYLTAGDPEPGHTVGLMHTLVDSGADIIELGVPFSDPMADGPVIQLACERALSHGTSLTQVLDMVSQFRLSDAKTPVVLMGYLNPVEAMGYQTFVDKAAEAGVDGVLLVDLPPEEMDQFGAQCQAKGLDNIFLIAPTTTDQRIEAIAKSSSGYVYYVSVKGVTGSASLDVEDVANHVARIREATPLPVGVGFGIKDAESARAVAQVSDGVIVGSVIVIAIAEFDGDIEAVKAKLQGILTDMRTALDQ